MDDFNGQSTHSANVNLIPYPPLPNNKSQSESLIWARAHTHVHAPFCLIATKCQFVHEQTSAVAEPVSHELAKPWLVCAVQKLLVKGSLPLAEIFQVPRIKSVKFWKWNHSGVFSLLLALIFEFLIVNFQRSHISSIK